MNSKAIARVVPIYDLNDTREPFYAATVHESQYSWEGVDDMGNTYFCNKVHWKVEMLWDGEGLPPVGTECDVITKHNITVRATILFVGDDLVVVKSSNGEQYVHIKEVKFRPIRSARDKAVDKMLHTFVENNYESTRVAVSAIYDAIKSGTITID